MGLNVVAQYKPLLFGGSENMNINGLTPKTFTYSPGEGVKVQVTSMVLALKDDGNTAFNRLGAIVAPANGILIYWSINGNIYNYCLLNDNADIVKCFPHNQHFGNSAILTILSIATPQGFGNSVNCYKGEVTFRNPIVLQNSDSINVVIQDDLSTIDGLQMGLIIEMEI